jgi:hypothetical protein
MDQSSRLKLITALGTTSKAHRSSKFPIGQLRLLAAITCISLTTKAVTFGWHTRMKSPARGTSIRLVVCTFPNPVF